MFLLQCLPFCNILETTILLIYLYKTYCQYSPAAVVSDDALLLAIHNHPSHNYQPLMTPLLGSPHFCCLDSSLDLYSGKAKEKLFLGFADKF